MIHEQEQQIQDFCTVIEKRNTTITQISHGENSRGVRMRQSLKFTSIAPSDSIPIIWAIINDQDWQYTEFRVSSSTNDSLSYTGVTGLVLELLDSVSNIEKDFPHIHHWKFLLSCVRNNQPTIEAECDMVIFLILGLGQRHSSRATLMKTKWFELAHSESSPLTLAKLLYSLELCLPMEWVSDRLTWQVKLGFMMKESLSHIRASIRNLYNLDIDEVGYQLKGHACVSQKDKQLAKESGSELLYGELLASGVSRAFDVQHLCADNAESVVDLGMGIGKLLLQLYLLHPSLRNLSGIELSTERYKKGICALRRMNYPITQQKKTSMMNDATGRSIIFKNGDLFTCTEAFNADIVILETHLPKALWRKLCTFIVKMKSGARLLTYENLEDCFHYSGDSFPFRMVPLNQNPNDRFYTTWSTKRGHRFYLWIRR